MRDKSELTPAELLAWDVCDNDHSWDDPCFACKRLIWLADYEFAKGEKSRRILADELQASKRDRNFLATELQAVEQQAAALLQESLGYLREVTELRAKLAEIKAERDQLQEHGIVLEHDEVQSRIDRIRALTIYALRAEGVHHKQYWLEQIAVVVRLNVSVLGCEPGVKP